VREQVLRSSRVLARFAWLLLVGCGRVAFDPRADGNPTDAPPDAFAGPSGSVLSVPGTGFVSINALCTSLTGPFTFEAWFRPSSTHVDADSAAVFALNSGSGTTNVSLVMWDWNNSNVGYFDDFYTNRVDTMITVGPDQWHFIAFTYEPGRAVVYANAQLATDITTIRTVSAPCLISLGQEWDGTTSSDYMVALYDEVSFWSGAKTQDEIAADRFALPTGTEPNLIARYTFDGTGADVSGHGFDVTFDGPASIQPLP
jgi:hypothetical protein